MLLIGFSYFSQRFALYTFCLIYVVYFLNESFWTEAALYLFKTFALDYVNIPKQNQTIDYRLHTNIKKNMLIFSIIWTQNAYRTTIMFER